MRSERVSSTDPCSISRRWSVNPTLAHMLVALDQKAQEVFSAAGFRFPGLTIISGYRSRRTQAQVNPSNPASNHTRCPSMAVDLRVGDLEASVTPPEIWRTLGDLWQRAGGRWGGFFPTPDLNHFELPTSGSGAMPIPIAPTVQRPSRPPVQISLRPTRKGSAGRAQENLSILF